MQVWFAAHVPSCLHRSSQHLQGLLSMFGKMCTARAPPRPFLPPALKLKSVLLKVRRLWLHISLFGSRFRAFGTTVRTQGASKWSKNGFHLRAAPSISRWFCICCSDFRQVLRMRRGFKATSTRFGPKSWQNQATPWPNPQPAANSLAQSSKLLKVMHGNIRQTKTIKSKTQ